MIHMMNTNLYVYIIKVLKYMNILPLEKFILVIGFQYQLQSLENRFEHLEST